MTTTKGWLRTRKTTTGSPILFILPSFSRPNRNTIQLAFASQHDINTGFDAYESEDRISLDWKKYEVDGRLYMPAGGSRARVWGVVN